MAPTPSFASLQYGLPYSIWQAIKSASVVRMHYCARNCEAKISKKFWEVRGGICDADALSYSHALGFSQPQN